jgi:hypothetical protein
MALKIQSPVENAGCEYIVDTCRNSFHYKSVQTSLRKCWQLEKKLLKTIKMHWTSITACLQESANPKTIKQASKQAINQASLRA